MDSIGIRELKKQTSKILRRVRDDGEVFEITYYGQPVAQIVPINPSKPSEAEIEAVITNLSKLSAEISAQWPEDNSALNAIDDNKRELL